ncbi:MAG: hypothetical protein OHK006_00460 [Thermodesulfovibrionales bacterium]
MHLDERLKNALSADAESLWLYARDPHPDVLMNACMNRNLSEEMAVAVARSKNASAENLGMLAGDARFTGSYPLKLALARNPKTPQRVVFTLLKYLKIFDLGDLTRDRRIPVNVRQRVEYAILERVPSMPSGVKTALAKRSSIPVVLALMERGDANVMRTCLNVPSMTEHQIRGVALKPTAPPELIRMIAEHPTWSLRYDIRYALVRNRHTPMHLVVGFIQTMKTNDLRELYADEGVPPSTRPFIHEELFGRSQDLIQPETGPYELPDDEEADG